MVKIGEYEGNKIDGLAVTSYEIEALKELKVVR